MGKLISIDNGGTLTDICVLDGDRSYHTKTITTPYDLSKCFVEGLRKASKVIYGSENLEKLLHSTDHIRYSTTQGTNALVQKKGPRVGLILAAESDVETLQQTDKEKEMFHALVGNRIAVINTNLNGDAYIKNVNEAISRLASMGASRLAVSLNIDASMEHEASLQKLILRSFPGHLLGTVPVVYATQLTDDSDFRRRTWSAVYNTFLHPAMELFLYHAEAGLRELRVKNPLLIYRNDGGSSRVAKTVALNTYSSGPRAGVEGLKAAAAYYGIKHLLMVDVGGTTTDFAEVVNGQVKNLPRGEVEGIECSLPLCDIVSIGAGGGSIYRVENGVVTVGPDSVGSAPGPACFGMGGKEATITDALLVMGLFDAETYFGGEMRLDHERATTVIKNNIAVPLGISMAQAVQMMIDAFAKKVAAGLNKFSSISEESVLLAFGGGGPMTMLSCAEAAGIDTVLVPRLAAVYSAFGIGFSDIFHSYSQTLMTLSQDSLVGGLQELRSRAERDMFSEGFELKDCRIELYLSQGGSTYSLSIDNPVMPAAVGDGYAELTLKTIAMIERAHIKGQSHCGVSDAKVNAVRLLKLPEKDIEVPVYKVEAQSAGASGHGPCVIEEDFYSCNVLSGWSFEFTDNRDILLKRNR